MLTLEVNISDKDFKNYHLDSNKIDFSELVKRIDAENAKIALKNCLRIAEETGLDKLTEEEINFEIKQLRDEKNHS